jgi:hypothetical protein
VGGTIALSGSNPTSVVTGLTNVTAAGAHLTSASAPGLATSVIAAEFKSLAGTVKLNAWMPTSSANPTLIASTNTETVAWWAIGF